MREAAAITLPGGLWADGQCRRSAELRPLTGEDEAFLAAADGAVSPAALATALLTRCLTVLAGGEVDADAVRGLTVGDREAVLLHLRRLSFGERLDCVLECPACGAAFDLELSVVELLQPPNGHRRERYEETIDGHAVRFRLPTGDDLEAAATPGAEGVEELLLHRCLEEPVELPATVAEKLEARIAELDPQAETRLTMDCPECGAPVEAVLDAAALLLADLHAAGTVVWEDVHALARHYGWSEREILALPTARRRLYLDLLAGGSSS